MASSLSMKNLGLRSGALRIAAALLVAATASVLPLRAQIVKGVKVLGSDQHELRIELRPQVTLGRTAGGEVLPQIASARVVNLGAPGQPMRMRISIPVALPGASGNSVEVIAAEYGEPVSGTIAPVPRLVYGADHVADEVYQVDQKAYAAAAPVTPVATLRYLGVARNLHEGSIEVDPYRVDQATHQIRFLRSVTLRLHYGAPPASVTRGDVGALARLSYVNAEVASGWLIQRSTPQRPFRRTSVASARAWLRVDVRDEGLYALTADDFKAVGLDISSLNPGQIAIYGGNGHDLPEDQGMADSNMMRQVPAIVETADGKVSRILFYGMGPSMWDYSQTSDTVPYHRLSPYVTANSYVIAIDGDPSRSLPQKSVPSGTPTVTATTGVARVFQEDEKVNAIDIDPNSGGSGRDWFGDEFRVDIPYTGFPRTYSTSLPGLDRSQPILYRVRVAHTAKTAGTTDSLGFTLRQNGADMGMISLWPLGTSEVIAAATTRLFSAPATMVKEDNVSLLTFRYTSPTISSGYLDWFEIHYTRRLAAEGDQITFEAPTGQDLARFTVTNFSNTTDVVVLDVTDPVNVRQLAIESRDGSSISFVDRLHPRRESARYFVGRIANPRHVAAISRVPFADLRNRMLDADILVITHDDFRTAADKYVKYRNAQGRYKAAYVTTSEIYTEFSHGNLDPTALRDYIAFAYKNWHTQPRFVLLLGDGTYDYRNIATRQKQFVPTYESPGSDGYDPNYSLCYDDYFARLVGTDDSTYDQMVDLAIGRIPVESEAQAELVIDKLKSYEASTNYGLWRQTVILAADDAYQGPSDTFITQSEGLWEYDIPSWIEPKKIYLSAYPTVQVTARRKPAAEQDLMQFIQQGAVITNWLGHGNPNVWAHEYLLQKDEFIPRLTNDTALTFVTAATCNFGNFDDPSVVSGAEMFILQPNGGAVAVMSSTRASFIGPNESLIRDYFSALFTRDTIANTFLSIGEALMAAKRQPGSDYGNDQKYVIFGDPSMLLNFPKDSIEITGVNGINVAADTAVVGALSEVKIEGNVRARQGGALREDFSGRVIVTLYDADRTMTVQDKDIRQQMEVYGGRLFRGPAEVSRGHFSITFRVPKDIAFDPATARLHAYAYMGGEDATGNTTHIRVFGSDTTTVTDHVGPDMKLFLDDRSFRSGDMVSKQPTLIVDLEDTSGINSSGSGIGHKLEAWIDNSATSVDLTDLYQSDISTYRKGSAERQLLDLSPGEHAVRVRAWDIFNNPSESTVLFKIAEGSDDELQVADVVNFPNPMTNQTDFLFRHNQNRPVDVDIAIFTVSGRKVRELESRSVTDRFVKVHWDGTDADGARLANGVYFYRLRVKVVGEDDGKDFETIEKVAIVR